MAKRFTDTNKWKKIKSMPIEYKLLWLYICDDCDHAGIWIQDIEIASIRIGAEVTAEKAEEHFSEKIVVFDDGKKWFIPSFIDFQYGDLNPKNRVHESVLKELRKYDLLENKPLTSPLQGAKDKDKDKEQDKDKEKEGGLGENLLIPEMARTFKKAIPTYPTSKDKDFKALGEIARFFCDQAGESDIVRNKDRILEVWESVCLVVRDDNFYSQKSLTTISNNIQEILTKSLHGNKSGIKKQPQPNIVDIKEAHARRYGGTG